MGGTGRNLKVVIAGAGPGDEELITLKLQKRLAEAEVILVDRLVNPAIIEKHARKNAKIIAVGKQGYHEYSSIQEDINDLIVSYAQEGKKVLRLKGGDVALFSNVMDELRSLTRNNIEFEIIPGITAASGASATAGIPLTARGYAQGVHILAFNPNNSFSREVWERLATCRDTLVFYMAVRNLSELVGQLLLHSGEPATPIAIIEQATTPYEKVHTSTLQDCQKDFAGTDFSSPSLVIIGQVVKLYDGHGHQEAVKTGTVFPELNK